MTTTELVDIVTNRSGLPRYIVWPIIKDLIEEIASQLDRREDVKLRGLGSFRWVKVPPTMVGGKTYPSGVKLKFTPSTRFLTRRKYMSDEGMAKYGVVKDEGKVKESSVTTSGSSKDPTCPACDRGLDSGGACPVHGTEPFEPGEG